MSLKFRNPLLSVNVTAKDWEEAVRRLKSGNDSRTRCCPNAIACTRALRAKFRRHPNLVGTVGSQLVVEEGTQTVGRAELPSLARRVISVFDDRVTSDPATRSVYFPVVGRFEIDLRKALS